MIQFLNGAIAMASIMCSMFFFRGWRHSADRLLLAFAIAFALFAFERIALACLREINETRPEVYLMRLAAYSIIILAILRKNFEEQGGPPPAQP